MATLKFVKSEGCGNDFIIIDDPEAKLDLDPSFVAKVCDRHYGVGADGLMLVRPSKEADLGMEFFNSDGSLAKVCGNGLRCFAKYAHDNDLLKKTLFFVETRSGVKEVELTYEEGAVTGARVDMGKPVFETDKIPMISNDKTFIDQLIDVQGTAVTATCLSMGNPHCVIFVEDIESAPVKSVGSKIEQSDIFPERVNVEFVQPVGESELSVRVWERGAGGTLACGSGACAAVVAASKQGIIGRTAKVNMPGGQLLVNWHEDGQVYLAGHARQVFSGEIELP